MVIEEIYHSVFATEYAILSNALSTLKNFGKTSTVFDCFQFLSQFLNFARRSFATTFQFCRIGCCASSKQIIRAARRDAAARWRHHQCVLLLSCTIEIVCQRRRQRRRARRRRERFERLRFATRSHVVQKPTTLFNNALLRGQFFSE